MKKHNLFTLAHLILMLLLLLFSVVAAVMMIGGFGLRVAGVERLHMLMRGVFNVANAAALLLGVIYLLNEYGKQAAHYYKAFLASLTVETALLVLLDLLFDKTQVVHITGAACEVAKIVLLCLLIFKKDLGERNTWILFGVLLTLDVVGIVLTFADATPDLLVYRIATACSRLVLTVTIGLAIRGKYADKARRGTK